MATSRPSGRVARAIHLAHATATEQVDDAILTKAVADWQLMVVRGRSPDHIVRGAIEEVFCLRVCKQRFDFPAQRLIAGARLAQERRSFLRVPLEGRFEDAVHRCPAWVVHSTTS